MLKQGAVLMRCRRHTKTSNLKYSSQKDDIFRRIKENIGLPGNSGRIGVRTMCHTRWTIKVDALGSITSSNCTVLRSTPDDAKDVDRARYGDEGKNSRHFVSNEQIPLPVRDHIGRTTAETRQQLESWNLQHTSLLPRTSTIKSGVRGWGCGDAQWNPGRRTSRSIYSGQRWLAKRKLHVDVGEPALPRRRKTPIRFDDICCAKETSRKQLRQRTNSRPTAAVGR